MIVPQYWAEARREQPHQRRRVVVRRFGWSDDSTEAAQAHADERADAAMARLLSGEALPRFEPKTAYNGASGVPIREEVLSRHGAVVITRNAYGARCLNTPNVLFADIDDAKPPVALWLLVFSALLLAGTAVATGLGQAVPGFSSRLLMTGTLFVIAWLVLAQTGRVTRHLQTLLTRLRGGPDSRLRRKLAVFLKARPDWRIRLYRTPQGYRLLVMHAVFDSADPSVAALFNAVGSDPVYAAMCRNQHCFRARVSAKPWRIGLHAERRLPRAAWPVSAPNLAIRQRWVALYEAKASAYAACEFIGEIGDGGIHRDARAVQELHDRLCQTGRSLPLA